jgi:hypothetical protein
MAMLRMEEMADMNCVEVSMLLVTLAKETVVLFP